MASIKLTFSIIILFFFSINSICFAQFFSESNSGVTVSLNSVGFISAFPLVRAWACGDSGTVLRSTNGGLWINVSSSPIPLTLSLNSVCVFDVDNTLVAGSDSDSTYIFMTSNSGASWIRTFSQANGFIYSVGKTSATSALAVGKPVSGRWSLWKTNNKGLTWDSVNLYLQQNGTESGWPNAIYCDEYNNSVWFGTNNSRIYKVQNFSMITTEQVNLHNINAISINYFRWAGGNTLIYSTNSGSNWLASPSNPPGSNEFTTIFNAASGVYVTRLDNKLYKSTNNGTSWNLIYAANSGSYKHFCYTNTFEGGLILVRSNGGITISSFGIGLNNISSEIPKSYSLSQNFPNPFNPSTKIKFAIPIVGTGRDLSTILKVYNMLGEEISTLVNEQLNPGTYEVDFDGNNYSSGVYYYKLSAGDYLETKKMILIK